MNPEITTILFDADGVLQRPNPQRRARWIEVLGPDKSVDDFLHELFAAEAPALAGRGSFTACWLRCWLVGSARAQSKTCSKPGR